MTGRQWRPGLCVGRCKNGSQICREVGAGYIYAIAIHDARTFTGDAIGRIDCRNLGIARKAENQHTEGVEKFHLAGSWDDSMDKVYPPFGANMIPSMK